MLSVTEANKILLSIANKKGFKVQGNLFNNCKVNFTQRKVILNYDLNDERNILFSHELGHIYLFKIWKWLKVLDELLAWIIGYFICKVYRINTKDFWKIAKKCLKTYTSI